MERIITTPRNHWQSHVESMGCSYHTINGKPYWNEQAYYQFKPREIIEIETATRNLETLCMEVVDHVVKHQRYEELNIPEYAWRLIELSWQRKEKALHGRMDFSYDGNHPPKLLEYNADTPLCLLEASILQHQWLNHTRLRGHQFNKIHKLLVKAWKNFDQTSIHLTCLSDNHEDFDTTTYLANTINEANLLATLFYIDDMHWNGRELVDDNKKIIETLYKLYPWEWWDEETFHQIQQSNICMIEPAWKMILSNKALLVLLWEMFPDHPNLLPAYFDSKYLQGDYVKKPLLGREGDNISLHTQHGTITTDGFYEDGKFMYQQAHLLPNFSGNYPVIGSWLIAGEPAGIGVREDDTPITRSFCRFVPHIVSPYDIKDYSKKIKSYFHSLAGDRNQSTQNQARAYQK